MTMNTLEKVLIFLGITASILHVNEAGNAILVNNGYQNVTVAISSLISPYSSVISDIQDLFEAASPKLFTATGKRAYFATVILYLPTNWNDASADSSESDSYYEADIRIADQNIAYGDLPYTQQSRGCGETGDFIHLTPTFITSPSIIESKYGPGENLLVHEWIKYRYGVFDENGYGYDYTYPQQYFGSIGTEYNMCNNTVLVWANNTCYYDSDIPGIPSHCNLTISPSTSYNNNITNSLLSMVTVPKATTFCDEDSHNSEAPNKQNILCDGQSAMKVILQHEDFQNGQNPPSDLSAHNPLFYQENQTESTGITIFFLVWDPMTLDQTYYTAGPALLKYIHLDFPEDSYFGAIDTVDTVKPFVKLTQIESSNRDVIYEQILATLRTSESPIGNVLGAVQGAIKEIHSNRSVSDVYSTGIVVMSNTRYETDWDEVCSTATSNDMPLYLVTYSEEVANEFDNSSYCTGRAIIIGGNTLNWTSGNYKFMDDDVDLNLSEDIQECLKYLEERKQLDLALLSIPAFITPAFAFPVLYHLQTYLNSSEDTFVVNSGQLDISQFYVETCTNIHDNPPGTLLTCWLGNEQTIIHFDSTIQAFHDDNILNKNGVWSFGVSQITTRGIQVPYTVYALAIPTSKSSSDDSTIHLRTWVAADHEDYFGKDQPKVQLFASLYRGTTPVFDARVTAKVANDNNEQIGEVTLLDNGSGNPDITANDGVYSAYFTQLVNSENFINYYISIVAEDNGGLASYPTSQYPWISGQETKDVKYCDPFFYKGNNNFDFQLRTENVDYPSGRIYDLRVVATQGSTVTIQWTAPGANYDSYIAPGYSFKCSTDKNELVNNFDDLPDTSEISPIYPQTPTFTLTVTLEGINDKKVHFCAVKVWEDVARTVLPYMSNVISYYIESR